MKKLILLGICILFLIGLSIGVYSATTISDCTNIVTSRVYLLDTDIIDSSSKKCMNITIANVTLDCQGHTVDGIDAEPSFGIIPNSSNVTIKNCNVSDWQYNIYLDTTYNNIVVNNNISSSTYDGVVAYYGGNHTIVNNTFERSQFDDILLQTTVYNIVVGNYFTLADGDGIFLYEANYSQIYDNTVFETVDYGFYISDYSRYNTFYNNTLVGGEAGIYMEANPSDNVFYNNVIRDASIYGIYLKNTFNNTFYNNLFNNSVNVFFVATIYNNTWNISNQTGVRIISNGTNIGGNYWTNPDVDGNYSDTCTDLDTDGFCDVAYNVSSGKAISGIGFWHNVDYLPLSDEYILDITAPIISNLSNHTTTNSSTYITWNTSENANYTFKLYNASNRTNEYEVATANNTNYLLTRTLNITNILNFTTYWINLTVCDSSGNCAKNNTFNFTTAKTIVIDTTQPSFSLNSTNASSITYNGTDVQINLTIKDDSNISAYTLTTNDTSDNTWINESIIDLIGDDNVTMIWNYTIKNFTLASGTFGWQVWANDTSNNVNVSDIYIFTVQQKDTTSPTVTIIYPLNNSNISSNSIDLNASAVDDYNSSSMSFYWVINGTTNTTTIDSNSTFNASDGNYNLTLFVSDGLQNGSSTIFFTLDTIQPSFSNNKTNASSTTYNATDVQINLTIADGGAGIDFYRLTTNDTSNGVWVNETIVDADETSITAIFNYSIHNFSTSGGTFGWRVWANDTLGQVNISQIYTLVVQTTPDTTPPTYSNWQNNASSTTYQNGVVNFSIDMVDDRGLNSFFFAHNQSGTMINITNGTMGSVTSFFFNYSLTITSTASNYICAEMSFNDTSGNVNLTSNSCFTVQDTTPPIYSNFQNNASTLTKINGVVNWSINLADNIGLSSYFFAHNQSGTLTNVSNGTLSSTSISLNKTITITKAQGNYICGQYWFNDSSNNVNQTLLTESGACFTVVDTLPTVPTSDSLTPNDPVITDELEGVCSGSTDADSDTITYHCRFYDITDSDARQDFSSDCTYQLDPSKDTDDQFRVDCRATTPVGNSPTDRTGTDLETVSLAPIPIITSLCYQETANDSSVTSTNPTLADGKCSQIYNGTYGHSTGYIDIDNTIDGDWDTTGGTGSENFTINYTKPLNVLNATWQIRKLGIRINYSIPSICFDAYPDKIRLLVFGHSAASISHFCWNSTDWSLLEKVDGTNYYREEAIWWRVIAGIDNCTLYSIQTLNISLLNESHNTSVNGTMEFLFSYNMSNYQANYSTDVTGSEAGFCISEDTTATSDILISYTIGATTYEYNTEDLILSSINQSLILYSQEGTTAVTFTVTDLFDDPIDGAIIKILKHDIATNTFKTTEVLRTNIDGEAIGNIVLTTVWYKFIIQKDGVTHLTTDPFKIFATTKVFRIDLTADDWFANYDTTTGVSTELNFTNSTKNFRYTWNDPTGSMHQGCLQVVKINRTVEKTICDNCVESTAATILCNIGTDVQGNRYIAQGYLKYDLIYMTDILEKIFGGGEFLPLWEQGAEEREFGVFISFMLITALILIGIWSPVTAIVMTLVGFFIVSTLGFIQLQTTAFITLAILGIIVIYRLSKK